MINGNFEILAKYNSIYLNFLKTNESSFSLAERNPLQIYHYCFLSLLFFKQNQFEWNVWMKIKRLIQTLQKQIQS